MQSVVRVYDRGCVCIKCLFKGAYACVCCGLAVCMFACVTKLLFLMSASRAWICLFVSVCQQCDMISYSTCAEVITLLVLAGLPVQADFHYRLI